VAFIFEGFLPDFVLAVLPHLYDCSWWQGWHIGSNAISLIFPLDD
jgi:hypothetical protein